MKRKFIWSVLSLLLAAAMLLASCGSTTSTTTPATTAATTTSAAVTTTTAVGATVLTVTEGSQVKTYSMAALQALPSVSGSGGSLGKGGTITGPFPYQGVALSTLLNAVGGITSGEIVTLTSSDNYTQQLTYDQIISGTMLNYYDTTGNPVTPSPKPTLTIIYSENGAALDISHGPTELGALALSSPNILTDGSLWAKMVVSITVTSGTVNTTTTSMSTTPAVASTTATTTTATPTTTTTVPVVISTTPVATTPVLLTVVNGNSSTTYSLAQLQQLQPLFASTGYIKGAAVGSIDAYVGVPVKTILAAIPSFSSSNSVTISDPTGYSKTFTYAMIMNGTGFTVLDNTGATVASPQAVVPFIAYSKNGAAFDSSTGPLYLAFSSGIALNQYTQSSLWIKNIVTITIVAAQ
jgi:hypothetical protein